MVIFLFQGSHDGAGDCIREHDVFIQLMKLKNTLRWMRGEDLITHLGLEYFTTNGAKRQEPARKKILVIGGTLFIGRALVKELLKTGHEVSILHRRPRHDLGKKVAGIVADRNDPEALKRALAGKNFDIVYDNVYDWERGTTAAQVEATARACGNNLERYIFMSSVAAYGDGLNHHEGDALAPDDHPDAYVRNKAMSESTLFRGCTSATVFRWVNTLAPAIHLWRSGRNARIIAQAFFLGPLRARSVRLILPGDGRRLDAVRGDQRRFGKRVA